MSALAELPKLRGLVEKPRFFELNATICAHGLPDIEGCPAEAITSVESKIQVDPNLCQGGGACATTCPTGAITYRYPRRADTLEHLARLLTTYRDAAGASARWSCSWKRNRASTRSPPGPSVRYRPW